MVVSISRTVCFPRRIAKAGKVAALAKMFSLWQAIERIILGYMGPPANRKRPLAVTRLTFSTIGKHELESNFFRLSIYLAWMKCLCRRACENASKDYHVSKRVNSKGNYFS